MNPPGDRPPRAGARLIPTLTEVVRPADLAAATAAAAAAGPGPAASQAADSRLPGPSSEGLAQAAGAGGAPLPDASALAAALLPSIEDRIRESLHQMIEDQWARMRPLVAEQVNVAVHQAVRSAVKDALRRSGPPGGAGQGPKGPAT